MITNNNSPLPYIKPSVINAVNQNIVSENTIENKKNDKPVEKTKKENSQEIKKKYEKFVKEIARYSVNMNDFDFQHMLKNVFDIGGKLALSPEDILKNKDTIKKFLPKVGDFLDKADNEYNKLKKSSITDGDTQLLFKNGELIFKTGQKETQLDSQGKIIPVKNDPKVKTETSIDLAGMSAGIQTENKQGDKFGAKADIDDKRFSFNIKDKKGVGQSTTLDLKNEGFNTNFSPDGKNNIGVSTQANGYSHVAFKQNGKGSINIAGGAKKGTVLSLDSDKVGGVQVNVGKNQQTVLRTNVKTNKGEFGASVRTGNNQGTQVNLQANNLGGLDIGVSSNGFKAGVNVNGTGARVGISKSNDAVNQSVDKEGKTTTSITDDNKWDSLVTVKDKKFGTIGLNFSKRKADTYSIVSKNYGDDIKCKQDKIKELETENKDLSEIPKSKRTEDQKAKILNNQKEMDSLGDDIVKQAEIVETKTNELMLVPEDGDNSKPGHETAKGINKGDVYKLNKERKITYGAEAGVIKDNVKASSTKSKNVDIDLSIEGLGDNKVKVNVSRKVEIDNKSHVNLASGIGKYESEFENDKSVSYEVILDLDKDEGKKLYDEIMSSASTFKDKLPNPEKNDGINILNFETEDQKTKDATKDLNVSNVVKIGINKSHEITKNINLDDFEMTGDFTKTINQDGDKIPVLGKVFSDEKMTANGSYIISKNNSEKLKDLETKKTDIKNDKDLSQEEKDNQIKLVDNQIEEIRDSQKETDDTILKLQSKKESLKNNQNIPDNEKKVKINEIKNQIETKNKILINEITSVNKEKDEINKNKKALSENKNISKEDKELKIIELDKKIKTLDNKIDNLKQEVSNLKTQKLELQYSTHESNNEIKKIDAQIKEIQSDDDKTSFKVTIDDSKVKRNEIKRYTTSLNYLTNDNITSSLKTKEYNDKSAISILVELFADKKDVDKIINSTKQEFINAAKNTPGISRNGDGVRILERRINRSEENAIKEADQKGLKNPSVEREAFIRSARLDTLMKFVENNGRSGIAMLQTLTHGALEVKKSEVEISGFKADNIINNDRINQIDNKINDIKSDNQINRKELKNINSLLKEALEKNKELNDKIIKIKNNPLLSESQKTDLIENLEIKILDLTSTINKLQNTKKISE